MKITAGETAIINATIDNNGTADANNIEVCFYDGTSLLGTTIINVVWGGQNNATFKWVTNKYTIIGNHIISARVGTSEKSVSIIVLGLPNVYVNEMTVDKTNVTQGETISITGAIANNGTADAHNVTVIFYDGTNSLTSRLMDIPVSKINTTNYLWQTTYATSIGIHNLKVVVGISWKNVTVLVNGKPNVYLKQMTIDRLNISTGESVNITTMIDNNGTADALNVRIDFFDNNISIATKYMTIAHSKTIVISQLWRTTNATSLGSHRLRGVLGTVEKNITVIVVGKSNVYFQDLTTDKSNISIGEDINIEATVGNDGTADATNVRVMFYDGFIQIALKYLNISRNKMNSSIYIWKTNESTSVGPHVIKVIVANKERNITIMAAGKPNIYVKTISVDKKNVSVGENIIITAIIGNNGSADAVNVAVSFYDGNTLLGVAYENISKGGNIQTTYKWTTKRTLIGIHNLRVIAKTSEKEMTVRINQRPVEILNLSISNWLISLVIFLIIIITIIFGYDYYKKYIH
jgi:subtilase family serine protease